MKVSQVSLNGVLERFFNGSQTIPEQPTDICGTRDVDLTKAVQFSNKDDVIEQTDPVGKDCSTSTGHIDPESRAEETSTPAGEDLSPAALVAKTFAEQTEKALASVAPSLVSPENNSLKGIITSIFELQSSPAGERTSEGKGAVDMSITTPLNGRVTIFCFEVFSSLDGFDELEPVFDYDMKSVIRSSDSGYGQINIGDVEDNLYKPYTDQ